MSLCLYEIEIATPYFCFYSGTNLLKQVKAKLAANDASGKREVIADYCTAIESKAFKARKNLLDQTIHGKPCIDSYSMTYSDPLAVKFDPISSEISSRAMCAEFVKEINVLLDMAKSSLPNALRYSYLISTQVDLET